MNAVGIDVSKGKSTVAVLRPFGEVVASPFDVAHTGSELKSLADFIKKLRGETKVVMEATGNYYEPIARYLHEQNIFVSVVNPVLFIQFLKPGYYQINGITLDLTLSSYSLYPSRPFSKTLSSFRILFAMIGI